MQTQLNSDVICSPDINECIETIDNCHMNATCSNTDGSFTCSCNQGFSGDGVNCDGETIVYRCLEREEG